MLNDVRSVLALDAERDWQVPIVLTEAGRGEGVSELWEALGRHREQLENGGELEQRRRVNLAAEVFAVASARAKTRLEQAVAEDPELQRVLAAVQARQLDPLSAVDQILGQVFRIGDGTTHVR
jgi:LAO/AO transport system kinase